MILSVGKGFLVVLSSPSGGGKTTIIRQILEDKIRDLEYSISATTRKKRANEVNGKDYFFLSKERFNEKIENHEFVEWEIVHGEFYGTLRAPIEKWLKKNKIVLMDLDVKGAIAVRKMFPNQSVLIFLKPPSEEVLKKRLTDRLSESENEIEKRLKVVNQEVAAAEKFDHVLVNDDLHDTVLAVKRILLTLRAAGAERVLYSQ